VKVLIAAGGSGGHIFPAIAVAKTLLAKERGIDILFVGSDKALDRRIFEKGGFRFALLSANKLPYRPGFGYVAFLFRLLSDIVRSFFIISEYKPAAVIGFGGYICGPVILISRILKIPRIVHEQNVVPGRANNMLFGLSDTIAISFEETKHFLLPRKKRVIVTGNPIRASVVTVGREEGARRMGLSQGKFSILVIGGSQGAHFLNEVFVRAVALLDDNVKASLQVVHICGIKDYDRLTEEYKSLAVESRVYSFVDSIEEAYSAADLVVTRSGSSALFELAFFGKPMILVPYPFARAHQAENGRVFEKKGAAVVMEEGSLTPAVFRDAVVSLMNDRARLKDMGDKAKRLATSQSADILAQEVLKMARR